LSNAREQARQLLSEVSKGIDPRQERACANVARFTNTFSAVLQRFIEQEVEPNVRSWRNVESALRLHVLPYWSDRPIEDVRRRDVHAILDELTTQNKNGAAREVRKHLSKFFNWALDREIVNVNPVQGLQRKDLRPQEDAGRALTNDELRAVFAAAIQMGYPFGPMYQLLILTGQRRNEWAEARRSEVDLGRQLLEVGRERFKSGRDHLVPLAAPSLLIVQSLPKWTGKDHFLFSSRDGKVPVSGFSKAKAKLDALAAFASGPLPRYRVHDFRVTCETRLAQLGFKQEVRDAVLGHAKPGLQKTYNKHDYLQDKHDALNAYAAHIGGIVA
jgi:integrase